MRANLVHVVPAASAAELDRLVREAFSSYARYWADVARLQANSDLAGMSFEGTPQLNTLLSNGPAIIALPHLGSWEPGGLYMARAGRALTTVAEELEPPALFHWFVDQREALGIHVIGLRAESTTKLLAVLRAGEAVALIADRDVTGDGVEVEFFGAPTSVPGGPALLALRSGAPIFPTAIYHDADGGRRAVIRPALEVSRRASLREDVQRITQDLVFQLELLIRAAPEQWHVFQANWPADSLHRDADEARLSQGGQ